MSVPAATDAQVRDLAKTILSRPEYAGWHTTSRSPLATLLEKLGHWMQQWLNFMGDLALHRPILYWLILAGLLAIIGLLLAHLIWSIHAALVAPAPGERERAAAGATNFADEAEQLAGAGRFLEAAHRLQLASIELLLQRRVFELSRSDPNRILRRRLRDAALPQGERQALLDLLQRLEQQWFRDRREDRNLYDSWRALHERLLELPRAA